MIESIVFLTGGGFRNRGSTARRNQIESAYESANGAQP
jgi:hypothetical protein